MMEPEIKADIATEAMEETSETTNGAAGNKSTKQMPWHRDSGHVKRGPLPKAVQRRRNNARIKKMVAPKPPFQVLNELVGPGNVSCNLLPLSRNDFGMITAEINVEGKTFTGVGPNRSIAKNIAAEAAVHYVATLMNSKPTEAETNTEGKRTGRFEDSTPWGALASLALFKLFTDWQASGYPLPADMCSKELEFAGKMGAPPFVGMGAPMEGMGAPMEGQGTWSNGPEEVKMEGQGDFADDAGTYNDFRIANQGQGVRGRGRGRGFGMRGMGPIQAGMGPFLSCLAMQQPQPDKKHPVSLLNEKLGTNAKMEYTFTEAGETPATKVFTCTLSLGKDEEPKEGVPTGSYQGQAKSKKEAKRNAAVDALDKIFEIKY